MGIGDGGESPIPDKSGVSRLVRPAGMSDGHPDSPSGYPSRQSLLGSERWMWTVVLGHSSRHSQPSCPAMPTEQTDGQSLGPAGRHVRRPSR